jgi:molybdate transport system regulatory protein
MKSKSELLPRWRIVSGKKIAFGPGKAELLATVARTGSIGEAAKQMKMSYMRAWSLVQTMNSSFKQPLIKAARGGNEHGGAELTVTGRRVLALYRKMEKMATRAVQSDWTALKKDLKD